MKEKKSCPSSTASEGAIILGVINKNGTVGFISNKTELTAELYQEMRKKGEPEKRFRFSNNCVESGCNQWQTGKCSVIQRVLHVNEDLELEAQLPACSIRESCRWYHQEGAKACSFCPYIITDMLEKRGK